MKDDLDIKQIKELRVLIRFVEVYCGSKHKGRAVPFAGLPREIEAAVRKQPLLCADCAALVQHGIQKRIKCPLDPKPSCKKCRIHCYGQEYRARIREIMAFSGRRMIMRGRLDYLWHYYF